MKLKIRFVIICCSFYLSLSAKGEFDLKTDSLKNSRVNHSLVASFNGIYNYFSNKTGFSLYNPSGRTPNSTQMVYYWQYEYSDTYTFDLSLMYNRFISKHFSLSSGLRFDQLKGVQNTVLYVDSNSALPDQIRYTVNRYSLSVPLICNLYLKRFKFGLGLDAYFFSVAKSTYLFEYNIEKNYSQVNYGAQFLGQESVAFKLFRNKAIYLQLGLIHSLDFNRYFGYNKFFTCGLSMEFNRS